MKIYLAGKVPKGDSDKRDSVNWRGQYQETLREVFPEAQFIDPYTRDLDESDFLAVVGQDCYHIKESDLVVVNAETKLGAGTSQEYVIAKYFLKPVVTVLPKNTHHRRSNIVFHGRTVEDWVHPFIHTFSDFVVENVEEVRGLKEKISSGQMKDIQGIALF